MQHGRRGGRRQGEAAAAGEHGGGLALPDLTLRHGEGVAQAADRRETSGRWSWMRRSRGAGLAARSWLAAGEVLAASAPGNRWGRGGGGRGPRVQAAAFVALMEPRPRDSSNGGQGEEEMVSRGSAGGGVAASSGVAVNITTGPMTETEDDMAVGEEEEVVAASADGGARAAHPPRHRRLHSLGPPLSIH
uniref:DUF834 domain-containing protein n=1 Tax=Oryza meridionalis TaxID=40149 RepID=A0A0E0C9A0_9ORYZ